MNRSSVPQSGRFALLLVPTIREADAVARPFRSAHAPGAPAGPETPTGPITPWRPLGLTPNIALVMCGIGKANAAGAAGALLGYPPGLGGLGGADQDEAIPEPPAALICLGVGGALPGGGAEIGDVVLASACTFPDEGAQTDSAFLSCADLGFPIGPAAGPVPVDSDLSKRLAPLADRQGVIATISTCAGTDALAASRGMGAGAGGAMVEAMEGAAAGLVAWRLGAPFAEIRVVSNTTGRRDRQRWDLEGALARLSDVAARLPAVLE